MIGTGLRRSLRQSQSNSTLIHRTRPVPARQSISANAVNAPALMTEIDTMTIALIMNIPLFQTTPAQAAIPIVQLLQPHGPIGIAIITTVIKDLHRRLHPTPVPAPIHLSTPPDRLPLHNPILPSISLNGLTRRAGRSPKRERILWPTPLKAFSAAAVGSANS